MERTRRQAGEASLLSDDRYLTPSCLFLESCLFLLALNFGVALTKLLIGISFFLIFKGDVELELFHLQKLVALESWSKMTETVSETFRGKV